MTEQALQAYLKQEYPRENNKCEWKEFKALKSAISGRKGEDVISYVSAIANMEGGHLVLGVADETLDIVGIQNTSDYTPENLPFRLVGNCPNLSSEGLKVEEIRTADTNKIVWIIHIPKHSPRLPVFAHKTKWQRIGDSLTNLTKEREKSILEEPMNNNYDWSATIIEAATIEDLDVAAIKFAREKFIERFRNADVVNQWDDVTFLNKAHITRQGKITNAAIILLGKPESKHFLNLYLSPTITWSLRDKDNLERDFEHFTIPFLLASEKVRRNIRNLKYRYIQDNTLFPTEIATYDPYLIREPLHNCIAHQNYELDRKINVVEFPDELLFTNAGTFIPKSIKNIIQMDAPPDKYRNPFLAEAMFNVNMIDRRGGGIKQMFVTQRNRFFPMPDYDFSVLDTIRVKVFGKILDENYTKLLISRTDLNLKTVILLDAIQKNRADLLSDTQIKYLKNEKMIEGRKPNYYISARIAQLTDEKVIYTKNRALETKQYKDYILQHITNHGCASRKEINELLFNMLPVFMTTEQKKTRVHNIMSKMSGKEIKNIGTRKDSKWVLIKE